VDFLFRAPNTTSRRFEQTPSVRTPNLYVISGERSRLDTFTYNYETSTSQFVFMGLGGKQREQQDPRYRYGLGKNSTNGKNIRLESTLRAWKSNATVFLHHPTKTQAPTTLGARHPGRANKNQLVTTRVVLPTSWTY
jgi:hypothetical protein